jgi:hypothetical protein
MILQCEGVKVYGYQLLLMSRRHENLYLCQVVEEFLLNLPRPIAAQHNTVTIDNVTLRLVMECAGRGFRSQHRDIK